MSIVNPIEVKMHASAHGSLYEAIVALGLRARQINDDVRTQYLARIQDLEDVEDEAVTNYTNYDKLAISREFDQIPKPTFLAMKEMMDGQLHWDYPEA